jgi:glutamate carboxypeptidase
VPTTPVEAHLSRSLAQRQPRLVEELRGLVNICTGGSSDIAREGLDRTREMLTARLRAIGATVTIEPGDPRPAWIGGPGSTDRGPWAPPTAVCRGPSVTAAKCRVLLVGHLDTVHPPESPFRELSISSDGKSATGPGCVDMKGGLLVLVAALEALAEAGLPVAWTVAFNSDEETGTYCSDRVLRRLAREHDVGLVVEPAMPDGSLAIRRPGSGQFLIETRGRAAHVGRDFAKGVSAVNALARAISAVAELPDPARGLVANIGPLEGGAAANVVPDSARAWGNVRFTDEAQARELEDRLRAMETPGDALPGVRVTTSFNRPSKPTTPGVERLALMARAAAEDLGQALPFAPTGGVCDGNNLQAEGLPTVDTLGVRGGGLHTPPEWIELPSLHERAALLAVLISRLSAQGLT